MPTLSNENRASSLRDKTETNYRRLSLLLTPALVAACSVVSGLDDFSLTSGAATSGSSGDGPPACPDDPVAHPELVRNDCGLFVSASAAPGGDGTKEKPFNTFAAAADLGATRIYACAESYDEAAGLKFSGGAEIFAGFTDCGPTGAWAWGEASKATLNGAANEVALTLDGGDYLLRNLNVKAADATTAGASSIAVVVNKGKLDVFDGDLTAGAARDGAEGESPADDPMLNGDDGEQGVGVCMGGADNPGRTGKTKTCSTGGQSVAGSGGNGGEFMANTLLPAGSGTDGTPADPEQPTKGKGGVGQGAGTPAAASCDDGISGASGASGTSGPGATGAGTIAINGYTGLNGTEGTSGKPGQGGGGGGGSKGGLSINCAGQTSKRVGASGASGGTGGCGGIGGGGGQAGGSTIALLVLDSAVELSGATLTAGRAGDGGSGGNGQNGGQKGAGGLAGASAGSAAASCSGGDGGQGGLGGPGGGGQGGHSLGIAFQGGTAPVGGTFQIDTMNKGVGGPGGLSNDAPMNGKGADGMATNCWDFAKNASCGG